MLGSGRCEGCVVQAGAWGAPRALLTAHPAARGSFWGGFPCWWWRALGLSAWLLSLWVPPCRAWHRSGVAVAVPLGLSGAAAFNPGLAAP